jgi:hypothetical protein
VAGNEDAVAIVFSVIIPIVSILAENASLVDTESNAFIKK